MRNIGFPLYETHARHHEMLVDDLKALRDRLAEKGTPGDLGQMRDFLEFWLIRHITREDILIKGWIEDGTVPGR